MAKFLNSKPFMTDSDEGVGDGAGHIKPEYLANALLREAVQNARNTSNSIRLLMIDTLGLPLWMVEVAEKVDYGTLDIWHRYLQQGYLHEGVSLAQVEMLIKVKQYISEELMAAPDEDETKKNNFKSTIETAVLRQSAHPKRSKNQNFTPEKDSHNAPEYDGKDDDDDVQANLWVFPTRLVQWTIDGPGETIVKIDDLRKAYQEKMRMGDATGIPIQHLKYEVKDWVRSWKPSVRETYARPDTERRNAIEFYKRQEIRKLRAAEALQEDSARDFWKLAFKYLGKLARVNIEDISFEKRIEHQIRRKFNNRKLRVEGKTYLPPVAAGDMLHPMLEERVKLLVSKNKDLDNQLPWVIEVYFDAEAREDLDGDKKVTAGVGILLNKYLDSKKDN